MGNEVASGYVSACFLWSAAGSGARERLPRSCPGGYRRLSCEMINPLTTTSHFKHIRSSMLATKLTRAQLEFHAHRVWLRSFNLRKSPSIALNNSIQIRQASSRRNKGTNIPSHDRRNLQNRQTDPHSKYQNDASDMYAKRPARHKKALTEEETEEEALVQSQRALREASIQGDLDNAILCYRSIKEKKLIIEPVLTSFTEALLNYKRSWQTTRESKEDRPEDPQLSDQLENIIAELVRDFRRGALEPCYVAWGHILKYFTIANDSDAAMAFWKWVEAQDDHHLDASIYGIAIELLAAQDAPLEELEALYQKALSRFPAGFPAYHYSPNAVLQDRERAISYQLKSNLPEELLVGIMRGRFMRGDSQNAYLALDSALRLRPIGAQKQFTATIQRERPVVESYTVFAMACKSGIPPSSTSFREILGSLRQTADTADAQKFVWTVRAMLSATYLYGSSGGRISRNSLTEVIITLINLISIQGIRAVPHQEQVQLVDAVANLTRRTIAVGARFGVLPTIAAFNTTINRLGGFGRTEEIATRAIEEAREFGLVPTEVTWRSVLAAAGDAGDQELIPRAWERLVQERSASNTSPDSTDLHLLVNACISSKCTEFARPIIDQMSQLDSFQKNRLLSRLQVKKNEAPEGQPADVSSLLAEFAKINEDLDVLDEKTRDGVAADFVVHQPPMLLFSPPKDVRLPEAEMRKLYDELSIDKCSPKKDPSTLPPPDVSRITKVSFAELRYESWKLITYLIAEAERHDSEYIKSVDQAISRGERPPPRTFGELFRDQDRLVNIGLSDPPQEIVAEGEEVDVEKVRARIMELRRVELPQPEATESK